MVVTAEKRETVLQRTPIAATVLDAEDLKQTRAWSFSDVTALAPSLLTTEHGSSTSSLFINIRGVMGLHSQTAVATYVDGVYQFEGFGVPLTFNNVDNIEVLRGPQGTLYGRNAFGGVINIKTKQPTNTPEGYVSVSYGNFEQQRYQASYSTPIIKNKLFAGVTAQFDQREGVYQNTVTNDDFDRPQSISGGLNLRYLATDKLDVTFNGRFERNEDFGSYAWVRSDSILFAEPYSVDRDRRNIELRNNHSASVKINYEAEAFDIQSITSYQSYERGFPELLDVDFSAANARAAKNDFDINTFTQELRFSSKQRSDSPFDWTVGSFAFIAPNGTRDNAFINFFDDGETRAENENRFDNKGIAFYGQGNYAFNEQWEATVGLRYDIENQRLLQELRNVDIDGNVTVTQPFKNFESTFEAFTPKFILNYKPTENTIVYAQYARGFRPGGLNTNSPNEADVPFDPEYSNNYEIGIKNTFFDNRLKFNITGFLLQQRDQQITVIEDSFFLTRNTGNVDNLGAEIEVEALPLKGLQLIWNASVSDAEYKELLIADAATGTNIDLSGNKPLFNPPFVSFSAIQYTKEFNKGFSAFIRGEHRYTGEHFFNFNNEIRQSPYNLYNARIGGRYKNFELAFWARNLTERKYRTWATGVFLLGSPRFYGATLSYDF
ncbi:MAG: TonB-dependent receptor [Mesonia sp.]|uniref:TonB-dependent receptor n=1 Tax=Mesonia sp. TaxID=1960830 RepID=UPI003F9B3161